MSNEIEKLLVKKAAMTGSPIKGTLELTPLCNMNCKMCYIRHTTEEVFTEGGLKPLSFWIDLIPAMKEKGVLFLTLIGGEPFLYPYLQQLYEELIRNGFYLNLTTNATLLADRIPKWLSLNPPRYLTVSLYGASDETYQKVTGKKDGFTQTIKGIKNLLKAGMNVKLNYCVIPENLHDMKSVFSISKKLNLPIQFGEYNFPAVRKANRTNYMRLSPEQAANAYLTRQRLQFDKKTYREWISYIAGGKYNQCTRQHTNHIYCMAGSSVFWIDWKGNMMPCSMMDAVSVDLSKYEFKTAWDRIREMTLKVVTSEQCSHCDYREICQVCPAMMYAETGLFEGTSEYHCQMTQNLILKARELLYIEK